MRTIVALSIALFSMLSLAACAATPADVAAGEADLRGGCQWVCPKCHRGEVCPKIACRLECHANDPASCGDRRCGTGEYCCNPSCGICAPMGAMCIQLACAPPTTGGCTTDADCRTFSDYCTGCNCDALSASEPDPLCSGPGVRCFADPCMGHAAVCDTATGACVLQ